MKHIKLFESYFDGDNPVVAYHYSNKELNVGDTIISDQSSQRTYPLVWNAFKNVNPKLPENFGYAYPYEKQKMGSIHKYEVQAPRSSVIPGNLDYSVYYTMDALTSQKFDRSLPLSERLKQREAWLKSQAEKYFAKNSDVLGINIGGETGRLSPIELISDQWVITKKIS